MKKTDIDGIEFYVSNDGIQTGLSLRGISKLCGISHSSIADLITNLAVEGKPVL